MKDFRIFILLACSLLWLASCSESDSEAGEYSNWKERNTQYIDSIAKVAHANADGKWKVILRYDLDSGKKWSNDNYVYCYMLKDGDGTESPAFTDYVTINYSGRLIPTDKQKKGYLFDSNYDGELDPETDVPVELLVKETVVGFSTALQHMVAGDMWKVYIPAKIGYGNEDITNIPAYSTLIFDINLVSFSQEQTNK